MKSLIIKLLMMPLMKSPLMKSPLMKLRKKFVSPCILRTLIAPLLATADPIVLALLVGTMLNKSHLKRMPL
jgi:hypothetical protein